MVFPVRKVIQRGLDWVDNKFGTKAALKTFNALLLFMWGFIDVLYLLSLYCAAYILVASARQDGGGVGLLAAALLAWNLVRMPMDNIMCYKKIGELRVKSAKIMEELEEYKN